MPTFSHLALFSPFLPKAPGLLSRPLPLPHHHGCVVAEVAPAMTRKAGPVAWMSLWSERPGFLGSRGTSEVFDRL